VFTAASYFRYGRPRSSRTVSAGGTCSGVCGRLGRGVSAMHVRVGDDDSGRLSEAPAPHVVKKCGATSKEFTYSDARSGKPLMSTS
jgi:hypothetical protein